MVFRLFVFFVLFYFSVLTRYANKELVKLLPIFDKIMFPTYIRPERGLTSIPLQS